MKIAFFGAGLMGAGFVRRALQNGHQVNVWNRDVSKARRSKRPGPAPSRMRRRPSMGSTGLISRWPTTLPSIPFSIHWPAPFPRRCGSSSTIRRPRRRRRPARRALGRARQGFPPCACLHDARQRRSGHGNDADLGRSRQMRGCSMPELQKMTGRVMDLGSEPERAAAFKLFGNLTLLGLSGVISDLVRLAHAVGVPPADAVAMFKQFNPGEMLPARAEKIASSPYDPPSFTVSMARKDARLMIEEAARHNVPLGVISAVAKLYDEAIARGEGGRDTSAASATPSPDGRLRWSSPRLVHVRFNSDSDP